MPLQNALQWLNMLSQFISVVQHHSFLQFRERYCLFHRVENYQHISQLLQACVLTWRHTVSKQVDHKSVLTELGLCVPTFMFSGMCVLYFVSTFLLYLGVYCVQYAVVIMRGLAAIFHSCQQGGVKASFFLYFAIYVEKGALDGECLFCSVVFCNISFY